MNTWTSEADLRARRDEIGEQIRAEHEGSPRLAEMMAEWDAVIGQLRERRKRNYELRAAALDPRKTEAGSDSRSTKRTNKGSDSTMATTSVFGVDPQVARDEALRVVEHYYPSHLTTEAASRLDNIVRADARGTVNAHYLTAVGDPAYLSAFTKMLADPTTGHLRFSSEEVEAVRLVSQVQEQRAMSIGTGSAGGFGVPFILDP